MTVDIQANLKAFLDYREPGRRYASFDYCYNHFQAARESGKTAQLAEGDQLLLSCLHLGFYLASWGMMRPSGELLQRSVRELAPVIETVAAEPADSWELGVHSYRQNAYQLLALGERLRSAFTVNASDILVTKTMLGVFGCVPAFDRYFRTGFDCHSFCARALIRIGKFYREHQAAIDGQQIYTLNFRTGLDTQRVYSKAKIIDMIFFQEGFNKERAAAIARAGDVKT